MFMKKNSCTESNEDWKNIKVEDTSDAAYNNKGSWGYLTFCSI